MMGQKTLGEARAEVKQALAKTGQDWADWFADQLRDLEKTPNADPREIENLLMVRDALARDGKEASPKRRGKTRTRP